ncbi:MAG: PucR family transcriptional regulator [Actinomycetes bacterium]
MDPTLGQVLGQPALALRQLAGSTDLTRAVRWVASSELLDPTPYLEGGEILLTTGMNLPPDDDQQLREYVERIARRGVVALGLAVGLTHDVPPPGLVEAAEATGLTLFEVPAPTPFIAITRTIADLVAQGEREAVQRSLDAQRRLTHAATHPDDAAAVVRELARQVGGSALVADSHGAVLHASTEPGPRVREHVADEVRRLRPKGLRTTSSTTLGDETVEVYPLGTSSKPRWYLAVGVPGTVDRAARGSVTAAVSLLSIAQQRSDVSAETDRRICREVTRLLLEGDARTARRLQAAVGGRPVPDEVVVLACATDAGPEPALHDLLDDDLPLVGADVQQDLLVVVADPADVDVVVHALASRGARSGVSRAVRVEDAGPALEEARQALARTTEPGTTSWFEAMLGEGLGALVDPERARHWAEATLAPLRERSDGKTDLVLSLRTYLAHHGQWHPAAAELGIHRHTLRYRIRRVEQLLDVSVDSPETRMNLWFALQHAG